MLVNGYKIIKCPECGKHYIIVNPLIKENDFECWLCDKMTKTQATARAKQLPNAKLEADIYNHNKRYSYK